MNVWRSRGEGANFSRKISLMRKATTAATSTTGWGGRMKQKNRPKKVTLPSLETAKQITRREPNE